VRAWRRIAKAKSPDGPFDAKIGRGRLQDIELAAQTIALRAGAVCRSTRDQIVSGTLTQKETSTLTETADLCWTVQSAAQLLQGAGLNVDQLGEGGKRFILRETGADSLDDLRDRMQTGS